LQARANAANIAPVPSLRAVRRSPSRASVALAVAAVFLFASVASAAPAIVTAAEAEAHSAPFKSTPVLHVFRAGDKVSAEEQAHDGWRRVHTPDGRVGFVRDEDLRLEGAPVPAAPKPAAPTFPTVPAKVTTFELPARTAPAQAAPILRRFAEGDALAVSEDETAGFRRVVLADGRIAFVESAGLALGAPPAPAAPSPSTAAATAPNAPVQPIPAATARKPVVYVKDLDHLAELVSSDDLVHPKVDGMVSRHTAANVLGYGGLGVMVTSTVLGFFVLRSQDCSAGTCTEHANAPLVIGGLSLGLVMGLVAVMVEPTRNDLLDVVNLWNQRHTDDQFTIESHELGSGH
jgi:hypothetical protein